MVKIYLGAVNPHPGSALEYKTGSWRTMKPVVNEDKCIGCWFCYMYCPDSAIRMEKVTVKKEVRGEVKEIVKEVARIDYDYCKGCGICAAECPVKAIEMVYEEK
ncbi:MAG: 4Fe-4S binding protein [Thermoplasmata archaeon]|nr:4Fe-4S binding protein [Thermoplasmata archaeon]